MSDKQESAKKPHSSQNDDLSDEGKVQAAIRALAGRGRGFVCNGGPIKPTDT